VAGEQIFRRANVEPSTTARKNLSSEESSLFLSKGITITVGVATNSRGSFIFKAKVIGNNPIVLHVLNDPCPSLSDRTLRRSSIRLTGFDKYGSAISVQFVNSKGENVWWLKTPQKVEERAAVRVNCRCEVAILEIAKPNGNLDRSTWKRDQSARRWINISESGLEFRSRRRYSLGAILEFNIKHEEDTIRVAGQVLRCEHTQHEGRTAFSVATFFDEPPGDTKKRLRNMLQCMQREYLLRLSGQI
jgi:hypothetical protein